ncbi:O-antigen ligase family protein [Nocardioides limicola]|uniref:O-antigen ligase family protein n=1 Tax=Nocardioides limicola TaxID=2803368 RepID=UPI00193C48A6|nr:hypothetical protein [Nocardioides sp. DJM-14]
MTGDGVTGRVALVATFGLLVVALAGLATRGTIFAILAVGAALGLTVVCVLGPRLTGALCLIAAMALAPLDDIRPGETSLLNASDMAVAVGFALLVPTMMRRRAHVPGLYLLGVAVLLTAVLLSSAMASNPTESFMLAIRLLIAAVMLPLAFAWWSPPTRWVNALCWGYVGGQVVSTVYGLTLGGTVHGRHVGLTRHPNYYGLAAMVAVALCIYLHHRTPREYRWVVWVAGGICLYGGLVSGSRASTLGLIALVLMVVMIERSVLSAWWVLSGGLTLALTLQWLVDYLGPGSAVARILPGDYGASLSDQHRNITLEIYWDQFLASPLLGNGFTNEQFEAHNAYLQIAVALGVVGLAGFLMIGWSLMRPLFARGDRRALCYVAVSYAVVAPVTPSVWDRIVWVGLALGILASVPDTDPQQSDHDRTEFSPAKETT